ncbi:MAG TPA: hypothetical protein VFD82_00025 [Planctomycetota bacterium]|nr:hypothetical protein [Planctomycetota bacterium]
MKSRLLVATAIVSLAATAAAQTGRTMSQTGFAFPGATFNAVITYPPAAVGNIYAFMWSGPFPGSFPLVVPGFTFVGDVRVDLATMVLHNLGIYTGPPVSMPVAVPNTPAVLGAQLDCQSVDIDITQTFYFADNDIAVVVSGGPGNVEIAIATSTSTTLGDNDTHQISNATIGAPVSYVQPTFSFLATRHRGDEGFVEGYAGTFSGTSFNSDIDSVSYLRVGRRSCSPSYQTIGLPNGYEISIQRDRVNGRQFSLASYNRATGATTIIPGSTWLDTGTSATPVQQMFYFGFSRDGVWGAIYVKDSNTTTPFVPKVWAFRNDASQPVIDITPPGTIATTAFFDGSLGFTNDFLLAASSNGFFWTSATAPATLQPLVLPNTTATNMPNVWAFPLSWRVSRDGSKGYMQISSNPALSRGEMDIVKMTNNAGTPQVVNYSQFLLPTGTTEFGYSAITPSTANNSSNGIKASVSPNGDRLAFLAATTVTTVFPGLYVADGTPNPVLYTVPGALFYSEVAFINNDTVMFFAGASNVLQSLYKLDLTAGAQLGVISQVGALTDIRTRGQFWSLNKNWWYFVRSNNASTINDIVSVDCATGAVRSVTGTEFGTPGPVATLRTGSFNVTADPWFALEMQVRRAPVGSQAYFTARREVPGLFEDANVFRFDIENGGQAVMLTNNTGTGAAVGNVICIENLCISDDGNHLAYSQRLGNTATASTPENVFHLNLGTSTITQCSVSQASQSITDGSVRFCGGANPSGLVWSLGTNSPSVPTANAVVQFAALGSNSPITISAPPAGTRLYQVLGTH